MAGGPPDHIRADARSLVIRPWTIATYGLRYSAEGVADLLALMATRGTWGFAEMAKWAHDLRLGAELDDSDPIVHQTALAALAQLMAGRPGPDLDVSVSADLHQALRRLRESGRRMSGRLESVDVDRLDAQTNLAMRRTDYVERILPEIDTDDESRWMLETELVHPLYGRTGSTAEDWLATFNRLFVGRGLTTIELEAGDGAPFNRIVSAARGVPTTDAGGPLVSIIMSVYKPDRGLLSAVRSITSQTWRNLELLVVDDCSPTEYQPLIEEAVGLDDRITLLRMPRNGGTYQIRNFAIAAARGEFIAFQDSDDWSHPERIERQLRPLLDDPALVASMSRAIRVDEQLGANKVGFRALRQNASSLLFRREPAWAKLGGFDTVRKAADSEFSGRMAVVFGHRKIVELELPLALVQLTRDSLSRADFRFGWHDGNRVAYRQAYEFWHDRIRQGLESPYLDADQPRRFPAPAEFLGRPADHSCDVLVVSDWRVGVDRYAGGAEEVRALAGAGLSTVVIHMAAIRYARRLRKDPSPAILDLQAEGLVRVGRWEDYLAARLVLIRDPELLTYFRPGEVVGISAERVVVYAAQPAVGMGTTFHPAAVEANVRDVFGVEPVWQPATPEVAASLHAGGAMGAVLEPRRLGVETVVPRPYPALRGANRPVVGTTGLDPALRAGAHTRLLRRLLPRNDRYDVRIRDVEGLLDDPLVWDRLAPNWLVSATPDLESFLEEIDIFVGLPPRLSGVESVNEITRAIARGCVAVVDPVYEPHFGAAALYGSGHELRAIIDSIGLDPGAFAAQQQLGYTWCETVLSGQSFVDNLMHPASTHRLEKIDR